MSSDNFSGASCLLDALCCNIGKIVTIFTSSGGESGCGFTGLLVCANCDMVKIITTPPSAPPNPFCCCKGRNNSHCAWISDGCSSRFGTVCVIPTCQIVSFCFPQL